MIELKNNYIIVFQNDKYYVNTYEELLDIFAPEFLMFYHEKEEYLIGLLKILLIINNIESEKDIDLITCEENMINMLEVLKIIDEYIKL